MRQLNRLILACGVLFLVSATPSVAGPCKSCVWSGIPDQYSCTTNPNHTGYHVCYVIPGNYCTLEDPCPFSFAFGDALLNSVGLDLIPTDRGPCMASYGASPAFQPERWMNPEPEETHPPTELIPAMVMTR